MNFKNIIKKENIFFSILTIGYLILGVLFCVLPMMIYSFLETALCFVFLIYGGVVMFAYLISSAVLKNRKLIISAVSAIILGVLMLFIRSFFIFILAFLICIFAVFKVLVLKKHYQSKTLIWYINLILSILYFSVFAFVFISYIIGKFLSLSIIFIGGSLILEAVLNLWLLLNIKIENFEQNSEIEENNNKENTPV